MSECKHETVYRVTNSWAGGEGSPHWHCTKCDAQFKLQPSLNETLRKAGERGDMKARIALLEAEIKATVDMSRIDRVAGIALLHPQYIDRLRALLQEDKPQ